MNDDKPDKKPTGENTGDIELPFSSDWQPSARARQGEHSSATAAKSPTTAMAVEPRSANRHQATVAGNQNLNDRNTTCPKCGNIQKEPISCNRCGLVFANWRKGMERIEVSDLPAQIRKKAEELWNAVEVAKPGELREQAQTEFHEFCMSKKANKIAALKYRAWLSAHPDDGKTAELQNKLLSQAYLLLPEPSASKKKKSVSPRGLLFAIIVFILMSAFFTFIFLNQSAPE